MSGIFEGYYDTSYLLEKKQDTSAGTFENLGGRLREKILLDYENKKFIIKGINYEKFLLRLKEMYKYRGIMKLFEKRYSIWSKILYEREKIKRSDMKITQLEVPLFFALEIYNIFMDLADFYRIPYYEKTAMNIWNKTWISNFQKRTNAPEIFLNSLSEFNFEPKDYQLEYIKQYPLLKYKYDLIGNVLSFEQGLGKTFTSIALAECLNKSQIIIVCPNSLKENWAYEIKSYYKEYSEDTNAWLRDVYVNGLQKYDSKYPKFIITNQESIEIIFRRVRKNDNTMIIVDESHNFRNIQSNRTLSLLKLRDLVNCKDNLFMSGTPIKATPDEIIPVLRMIDPYFTEEMAALYKSAFSNSSNEVYRIVKDRFGRIIYRKRKADVLQLPEKHIVDERWKIKDPSKYLLSTIRSQIRAEFDTIYAEKLKLLTRYQERFEYYVRKYSSASIQSTEEYLKFIYNQSKDRDYHEHEHKEEQYKVFLKTFVYPNIADKIILKELEHISSQYIYARESAMGIAIGKVLPPAKSNCYIDIINYNIDKIIDMVKTNTKKTIIFTPFLKVADYTYEILSKNNVGCVLVTGATQGRMEILQEFKEDDNIDVLVATIQTLSTGVTLTEASKMIFFGTPYRSADFEQACDRIHRIGQTSEVYIYKILLESGSKNITDRIDEIMTWSSDISGSIIDFM